jgi:hypothetical protein
MAHFISEDKKIVTIIINDKIKSLKDINLERYKNDKKYNSSFNLTSFKHIPNEIAIININGKYPNLRTLLYLTKNVKQINYDITNIDLLFPNLNIIYKSFLCLNYDKIDYIHCINNYFYNVLTTSYLCLLQFFCKDIVRLIMRLVENNL